MSKLILRNLLDDLTELTSNTDFDYVPYIPQWYELYADYADMVQCVNAISSLDDLRFLCRYNLFFLLTAICAKHHLLTKWTNARCKDCCNEPYGQIQLWAREHHKSSIWTFGRTIQDILTTHGDKCIDVSPGMMNAVYGWLTDNQPIDKDAMSVKIHEHDIPEEVTICVMSATSSLSQAFLKEIMTELEVRHELKAIFPDILYTNPKRHAKSWGVNTGIVVKRNTNRKESTVEAWGLLNAQPTGMHFSKIIFDDIVTMEIAKSSVLNKKLVEAWENAFSIGSQLNLYAAQATRKHYNDPYSIMIERGVFREVRYTPYDADGKPVLMTQKTLDDRRKASGETTFAAEYLQEPLKSSAMGLNPDNIVTFEVTNTDNLALYFFCDPSKGESNKSDYTVYAVFGVDAGGGLILIDGIRDRLLPSQKWEALYALYKMYPKVKKIFYEEVGLCNDLAQFKERAINANHPSFCSLLCKVTQSKNKEMRILSALEPLLEQRKFFMPKQIQRKNIHGEWYDLVHILKKDEMAKFPFSDHDDVMDVCAEAAIKLEIGIITGIVDHSNRVINRPILRSRGIKFEQF